MKTTLISFIFILILGLTLITGCNKDSKTDVPVSFTDKDGNIFIPIDTINHRFDAYSTSKITSGHLKGIFNDTLWSSFYLAVLTNPYWDTTFHRSDTVIFPTHFFLPIRTFETDIDLKGISLPYHFLMTGLSGSEFKTIRKQKPTVVLTIDVSSN